MEMKDYEYISYVGALYFFEVRGRTLEYIYAVPGSVYTMPLYGKDRARIENWVMSSTLVFSLNYISRPPERPVKDILIKGLSLP